MKTFRIAVFSDSHGNTARMKKIAAKLGDFDCFFHLGDLRADFENLCTSFAAKPACFCVDGNCDPSNNIKFVETIVGGVKFFAVHGHNYGVKYGNDKIFYAAKERNATVCLFGHTHVGEIWTEENILFLNPGSVSLPRGGKPSYGILEICGNVVSGRIIADFGNETYKIVREKDLSLLS